MYLLGVPKITGQLADTPTRGLPTRGLDDSRTGHLADATGDFACLVFVLLAASARPRVGQSTKCPVRELAYPRVVQLPDKCVNGCALAEKEQAGESTAQSTGSTVEPTHNTKTTF